MYISKFRLFNYKCFRDSGEIELTPGMNIIVGQNNSGKTALLEALSLYITDKPHRSIYVLAKRQTQIEQASIAEYELSIEKEELKSLLLEIAKNRLGLPCTLINYESDFFLESYAYADEADELSANGDISRTDKYLIERKTECINIFQQWLDLLPSKARLKFISKSNKFDCSIDDQIFGLYYTDPDNKEGLYNFIKIKIIDKDGKFYLELDYPDYYSDFVHYEVSYKEMFYKDIAYQAYRDEFLDFKILESFRKEIYRFKAERLNAHECISGSRSTLEPDASNLAEVIFFIQKKNPPLFEKYNKYISTIIQYIRCVSIEDIVIDSQETRHTIRVWNKEAYEANRDDLSFCLSECGTGISQVLAILYVVLTSEEPRTIIIDEPQSFLHPGATRKLIEVLQEFPQHQYIIATHSPLIINAANSANIIQLKYENCETKASVLKSQDNQEFRHLLTELGVKLSDIFGADNIIWVEGETEEMCFPLILEKIAKQPLRGTIIKAVKDTGDFDQKKDKSIKIVFDIYNKMSHQQSLFPPALAFILDPEDRTEARKKELKNLSGNKLYWLPRRMYENYLLDADAIANIINSEDSEREQFLIAKEVQKLLETKRTESLEKIDGAKLLKELFSELSENRVQFKKTRHSLQLTKWLIENKCDRLTEIAEFLREFFKI